MARSFNGSSDTISIANQSNFAFERTQALTIACWVNPNVLRSGSNAAYALFSKLDSSSPNSGYEVGLAWNDSHFANKTGVYLFLVNTFGTNYIAIVANQTDISNSVWTHIAVTYDGSSTAAGVVIYINGVAQTDTGADALSATIVNSITPYIGSRNNTNTFQNGQIADMAVWSIALSAGQIAALAGGVRPINVNSANLVGWLPLDGYASPEPDLSGNGNNGTLTGTARVLGPPALWRISA